MARNGDPLVARRYKNSTPPPCAVSGCAGPA